MSLGVSLWDSLTGNSIGLSMEALLSFLLRVPADMRDWIEKCFIRAVAMAFASNHRDQARIDFIKRTTQLMEARNFNSLSRQASHAALIVRHMYLLEEAFYFANCPLQLIWAQVDNSCCQNRPYIAEKWCQLVLDAKVFENISRANRSTIKRRVASRCFPDQG